MQLFNTPLEARRLLKIMALVYSLAVVAALTPVQSFQVSGSSMRPMLVDGERVLVERWTPRLHAIERGDIVVFSPPGNPRRHLIKRVVGMPGESLEIHGGSVYVDRRRLPEGYLPPDPSDRVELRPVRLGPGEYFVLGDHRNNSEDSRAWGAVRQSAIVGRALLSYWPPLDAGPIR